MRLPIDTSALTFLTTSLPEPVMDFESRRQKTDRNGEPVFQVQVVAMGDDGAEVLPIKVPGEPKGLISYGGSVVKRFVG